VRSVGYAQSHDFAFFDPLTSVLIGAEVWLTDLKQVLPLTKANVDLNAPGNPRFHVVEYSWGEV